MIDYRACQRCARHRGLYHQFYCVDVLESGTDLIAIRVTLP